MGQVYLLYSNDLTTDKINSAITEYASKTNTMVYLISSQSLKRNRIDNLGAVLSQKKTKTFAEFENDVKRAVYRKRNYLSDQDLRLLLYRMIELKFSNSEKKDVFLGMRNGLFKLYQHLMFHEKLPLDHQMLTLIKQDFSDLEASIFELYSEFYDMAIELQKSAQQGEATSKLEKYITSEIKKKVQKVDLFSNCVKQEIDSEIGKADQVFFDGFVQFNSIQQYSIESALKQDKDVYFIGKLGLGNHDQAFVYEDNYKKIVAPFGKEILEIDLTDQTQSANTALGYFRELYPDVYLQNEEKQNLIGDGSIEMIAPFSDREGEIAYVVRRISDHLRSLETVNKEELKRALKTDVAVIMPYNMERHSYMLKSALKKVGLFVFNGKEISSDAALDTTSFEEIYYTKSEFLKEEITFQDGTSLNLQQKLYMFEKCFSSIGLQTSPRPLSSYPVGQYVREIYSFVVNGMNVHGFKLLLYSNWYYHARKSSDKWDHFVSDFKNIESYFADKKDIADWITEVDRIKERKALIEKNPFYDCFPLTQIDHKSLDYLQSITKEVAAIMRNIDFTGSIQEHVSALVNDVIDAYKIMEQDRETLGLEQLVICKLYDAASNIGKNSVINEVDVSYFANHVIGMLEDYEHEKLEEENNEYAFYIVGMENMTKYKQVFFIMAESGKRPKNYRESFPFTGEFLNILSDEKYGIECSPSLIYNFEYHTMLQNHGFQNMLDFTTEKLVITHTKYEGKNQNTPSIYCEDIATAFDKNIEDIYRYPQMDLSGYHMSDKKFRISMKEKNAYTITEFGTFYLCQKRYAHENFKQKSQLLYREPSQLRVYFQNIVWMHLLKSFAKYSEENNKVYSIYDDEAARVLFNLLPVVFEEHLIIFSFLNENERNDSMLSLADRIVRFLCYEITGANISGYYTVKQLIPENITCNGFSLASESDVLIYHGKKRNLKMKKWVPVNRSIQTNLRRDFLITSTGISSDEMIKRHQHLVNALVNNQPKQDRIQLAAKIIGKHNTQFTNGSKQFRADGARKAEKMVKDIVGFDLCHPTVYPSNYCAFCQLHDICQENNISDQKRYENEDKRE